MGIISNIINVALGFIGILVLVYLLYGGFTWMTSGGEEKKVTQAKNIISRSLIGVVIVLSSWAITMFVLRAIGNATGADIVGLGNTPKEIIIRPPCYGSECGYGPDDFYILPPSRNGFNPAGGTTSPNSPITITMNRAIDATTLAGNVHVTVAGVDVEVDRAVVGSTLTLTAKAACTTDADRKCLPMNSTITVSVTRTVVKSVDAKELKCGGTFPDCTSSFATNDIVDVAAPSGYFLEPYDGKNFDSSAGVLLRASVGDDVRIGDVTFRIDTTDLSPVGPTSSPYNIFTAATNFVPSGGDANIGKVYSLSAVVADSARNSSSVNSSPKPMHIVARPAHCFNNVLSTPATTPAGHETDIDCGGEAPDNCGFCNGAVCAVNTDCASGSCIGLRCVPQPHIESFSETTGAVGNYVTIRGTGLGTNGVVTFLGTADDGVDDKQASLACANAWSNNEIIVIVPEGAVSGPLMVKTSLGFSATTTATFTVDPAAKKPGLCWLSSWVGKPGDKIMAHGNALADSVQVKIGSLTAVSEYKDTSTVSVTIPGLPDGIYRNTSADGTEAADLNGMRVKVGSVTSNTLSFQVSTPPPVDKPLITEVAPVLSGTASGPVNQYVSIFGSNFGTAGKVWFTSVDRTPAGTNDKLGSVEFPAACGTSFWKPESVIVKVPNLPIGQYNVAIQRTSGEAASSNAVRFNITTGEPSPGVCRTDPSSGPVGTPVQFIGDNFGTYVAANRNTGAGFASLAATLYADTAWDGAIDFVDNTSGEAAKKAFESKVEENIAGVLEDSIHASRTVRVLKIPDTNSTIKIASCVVTFTNTPATDKDCVDSTAQVMRGAGSTLASIAVELRALKNVKNGTNTISMQDYGAFNLTPMGTWNVNNASQFTVPTTAVSGPAKLVAGGRSSNPTFFQVANCQANPSSCSAFGAGYQCCENGSCSNSGCVVTLPGHGYAWKFTTGKIPQIPRLVTQCNTSTGTLAPSPSPSLTRSGGNQVCKNAIIRAEFDKKLASASVSATNIKVWKCADETCTPATATSISAETNGLVLVGENGFKFIPAAEWDADANYVVEVKTGLRAADGLNGVTIGGNAEADTACNRGTGANLVSDNAYCWKFKAGNTHCEPMSLAMTPGEQTASELYVASTPLLNRASVTAEAGADSSLCLLIVPPAGTAYSWTNDSDTFIDYLSTYTVTAEHRESSTAYYGARKETGSIPAFITSTITPPGAPLGVGTSKLNVRFARPKVTLVEPNCSDACPDAQLRATFNTGMKTNLGMQLMLCADEKCLAEERVGNIASFTPVISNDDKTFSITSNDLRANSYYRVLIKAMSGVCTDGYACSKAEVSLAEEGANFQIVGGTDAGKYYSWIFRVRNEASKCVVAKVDIEPAEAAVEKTGNGIVKYTAVPRTNPDSCSANGQALNAWGKAWTWSIGSTGLAGTFMNLAAPSDTSLVKTGLMVSGKFSNGIAPGYNAQCLKRGSDVVLGVSARCGNGVWEKALGEACDDHNVLGSDGCSAGCLIEPFTADTWTRGGITGKCGDERIQRDDITGVGEVCDGGVGCSSTCILTGNTTTCGADNVVEAAKGEECADGNSANRDGCSSTCLLEGSKKDVSVCGDGEITLGEECDLLAMTKDSINYTAAQIWATCNQQTCLWKGVMACPMVGAPAICCGNNNRNQPGKQCDDGNSVSGDGCSSTCLLEGSSAFHQSVSTPKVPAPSFCGDGVTGPGEAEDSDVAGAGGSSFNDPTQFVTRVASPAYPFKTDVQATLSTVQGKGTYKVRMPGESVCVLPQATAPCPAPVGTSACVTAGGACMSTTDAGPRCEAPAIDCVRCASQGGSCVSVTPKLITQCGVSPASVPSPAPLVDKLGSIATPQSSACKNGAITGKFNVPMNEAVLRANLSVFDCGAAIGACPVKSPTNKITIPADRIILTPAGGDATAFHINPPTDGWDANKVYMVVIGSGIVSKAGVAPAVLEPSGVIQPNIDICKDIAGVSAEAVYACWQFKVGSAGCGPNSVGLELSHVPPTKVATQVNEVISVHASAINERCTEVTGVEYTWNSSAGNVANFRSRLLAVPTAPSTDASQEILARATGRSYILAMVVGSSVNSDNGQPTAQNPIEVLLAPDTCPVGQGTVQPPTSPKVCKDRPVAKSTPINMAGAGATDTNNLGVARNQKVSIKFDREMDAATLLPAAPAPETFTLQYEGVCARDQGTAGITDPTVAGTSWCVTKVPGTVALTPVYAETVPAADRKYTGMEFTPSGNAFLKPLRWYKIIVSKSVQSKEHVMLGDTQDFVSYFFTGAKIAPMVAIQINDSEQAHPGFFTDANQPKRIFTADALGQISAQSELFPIFPVEGQYSWDWGTVVGTTGTQAWSPATKIVGATISLGTKVTAIQKSEKSKSPSEAEVEALNPTEYSNQNIITATATIKATRPDNEFFPNYGRAIALEAQKTGSMNITVFNCKHPWPTDYSLFPWTEPTSVNPDAAPKTNFSMFYCRDTGAETLLPNLNVTTVPSTPSSRALGILSEYLFVNSNTASAAGQSTSRMATLATTTVPRIVDFYGRATSPAESFYIIGNSSISGLIAELSGPNGTYRLNKNYEQGGFDWYGPDTYYAFYSVPANIALGEYAVTWVTPGGQRSNVLSRKILVAVKPTLTGFVPSQVMKGAEMVITGTNFIAVPYPYFSVYDSVDNTYVDSGFATYVDQSHMKITVPLLANGQYRATLNFEGLYTDNLVTMFTVSDNAPSVSDISPSFGLAGTPIVIRGANFVAGSTTVTFSGGKLAAAIVVSDPNTITAKVPVDLPDGDYTFTVTTPAGSATKEEAKFKVTNIAADAPVISAVSPQAGLGGQEITLSGSHFTAGDNTVIMLGPNGVRAEFPGILSAAGSGRLVFRAHELPVKATYKFRVLNANGMSAVSGVSFTVATPEIEAPTKVDAPTGDVIGIRVMSNPLHLSPMDWYLTKGYTGSPAPIKIDGYEGIIDGRTMYVAAANLDGANLYTNIFIISSNEGARADLVQIFNQLKNTLKYNTNLENTAGNINMCVTGAISTTLAISGNQPIPCLSDDTCADKVAGAVCASQKSKIARDVKRLADFRSLSYAIGNVYQERHAVPKLSAGSYLPSVSTSIWPSWDKIFSESVGIAPPVDPLNRVISCSNRVCAHSLTTSCTADAGCAPYTTGAVTHADTCVELGACAYSGLNCTTELGCASYTTGSGESTVTHTDSCLAVYDSKTCWSANKQQFKCATDSRIYSYQGSASGGAKFGMKFEALNVAPPAVTVNLSPASIGVCEKDSLRAGEPCERLIPAVNNDVDHDAKCGINPLTTADEAHKKYYLCVDASVLTSSAPLVLNSSGICSTIPLGAESSICGDGVISGTETCEIGQTSSVDCTVVTVNGKKAQRCNSTCSAYEDVPPGICVISNCGDGKVNSAGNYCTGSNSVSCVSTAQCQAINASSTCSSVLEACDDGRENNGKYGYCNKFCNGYSTARCGNGAVDPGEQCDYKVGNVVNNGIYNAVTNGGLYPIGCSAQCTFGTPRCGDKIRQVGQEACEVGEVKVNSTACDTFVPPGGTAGKDSSGRKLVGKAVCVDAAFANIASQAACHWPNTATDLANAIIKVDEVAYKCSALGSCGDGTKDIGEECDDGNTEDGDACTSTCKINVCGDGLINVGVEECDDAERNNATCDAPYGGVCNFCTNRCKLRTISGGVCGNNRQETVEKCDGNDYGGKVCIGGEVPGSSCSRDADCGTGAGVVCSAMYCLNGLHCTAYKEAADQSDWNADKIARFDPSTRIAEWYQPNVDWVNIDGHSDAGDPGAGVPRGPNYHAPPPEPFQQDTWDWFSVRCEGFITPKYSETYTFKITDPNDYARLYLNGKNLVEVWVGGNNVGTFSGSAALVAGRRYPIKIEHVDDSDFESLHLKWQSLTQAEEIIPPSAFSYAPSVSGATLSCTIKDADGAQTQTGTNAPQAKGICLGGSRPDGTLCSRNCDCNTGTGTCPIGNGVCSYVFGKCSAGTHMGCSNNRAKFCTVVTKDRDCGGTTNTCISVSDVGISCNSDASCNTGGSCARGICNGGKDNGKVCSITATCAQGGTCTYPKCGLTCSAYCPTEFKTTDLAFKVISPSSKCVAGHRNNVGGLCMEDAICSKTGCGSQQDCVGGTTCESGKCIYKKDTGNAGKYLDASNVSLPCPGFINPDGTCTLCAPANTSTQTATLGSFPVLEGGRCDLSATPHVCAGGIFSDSSVASACVNDADCGLCDKAHNLCRGGIYKKDNLERACTLDADCIDTPDRAWLDIPQCKVIQNLRMSVDGTRMSKTPSLWVVLITDMSETMYSSSGYNEGGPYAPSECDPDADRDTRLKCAVNNLLGKTAADVSAIDDILSYDASSANIALVNFGTGDWFPPPSVHVTSTPLASFGQSVPTNTAAYSYTNITEGDYNNAQVFTLYRNSLADGNQYFMKQDDATNIKGINRTVYNSRPSLNNNWFGGCPTDAFKLAGKLLEGKRGRRVVITLTDACYGNDGTSNSATNPEFNNAKELKSAGIDMYAVSYGLESQAWQLKSWSSDCAYDSSFTFADSKLAMSGANGKCSNSKFFYQVSATQDVKNIYKQIIASVTAVKATAGAGDTATIGAMPPGFDRLMGSENLKCSTSAHTILPFGISFAGYGSVSLSNPKAEYCPVQ